MTASACAKPPSESQALAYGSYLAVRFGVPAAEPEGWFEARFYAQVPPPPAEGEPEDPRGPILSMPVAKLGALLITEDGERLPPVEVLELRPIASDWPRTSYGSEALGREVAVWQQLDGYMRTAARTWLRSQWCGGRSTPGDSSVLASVVELERQRCIRDLRQQHVPWSVHCARAEALHAWVRMLELPEHVTASVSRLQDELGRSAAFVQAPVAAQNLERMIRSEVDSVGGVWRWTGTKRFPGYYAADYRGPFRRRELATLAEYWDCPVWTRSAVDEGGVWCALTVGERIGAAAAQLVGTESCSREQFVSWCTK